MDGIDRRVPILEANFTGKVLHEQGIFTYDFDFNYFDYTIFLDGDFGFKETNLEPALTDNQIFRVLIIPADRIDLRLDFSDHRGVLEMLKIEESDIQRISLN